MMSSVFYQSVSGVFGLDETMLTAPIAETAPALSPGHHYDAEAARPNDRPPEDQGEHPPKRDGCERLQGAARIRAF